jgi:hypothetical protein
MLFSGKHMGFRKRLVLWSMALSAYCLFALTPLLFLHTHQNTDELSSLEGKSHGHLPVFGDVHHEEPVIEHGEELVHLGEHGGIVPHADESFADHFGLEESPIAITSQSNLVAFSFLPLLRLSFVPLPTLSAGLLRLPVDPVPISHCYFSDGFPPFLTSALPPPLHA